MSRVVAVAGESGPAKNEVAAKVVRLLRDGGIRPVFVIDADPASALAGLLEVRPETRVIDALEEVLRNETAAKERLIEQRLQQDCIAEGRGFDLVTMGKPGGLDAYCYLRTVFNGVLDGVKENYRASVLNCESGLDYLTAINGDDIDCLLVVAGSSPAIAAGIVARSAELPVVVRRRVLVSEGGGTAAPFDTAVGIGDEPGLAKAVLG